MPGYAKHTSVGQELKAYIEAQREKRDRREGFTTPMAEMDVNVVDLRHRLNNLGNEVANAVQTMDNVFNVKSLGDFGLKERLKEEVHRIEIATRQMHSLIDRLKAE